MSVVAEFAIPCRAVPGGTTLEGFPDATISVERIVPTGEVALPYFWVFHVEPEEFNERLGDEPEIADVRQLAEVEYGALFEAKWKPDADVIEGIKRLRATILDAVGTNDGWTFQVRAEDRDRLNEFRTIFTDQGIPVEVTRVFNFAELVEGEHPVTPEQRETLLAAYRRGYFDKPRQISQTEIGEEFGITGRAVSDRLRRGTKNLIASSLLEPSDADER